MVFNYENLSRVQGFYIINKDVFEIRFYWYVVNANDFFVSRVCVVLLYEFKLGI